MLKKINKVLTGHEENFSLNPKELFSDSFKGLSVNRLQEVVSNELKPRHWFKTFLLLLILTLVFYSVTFSYGIVLAFPWLALMAASVLPITVAVFLYEFIKDEYISLTTIILVFLIGTAISFVAFVSLNIDLGSDFLNTVIAAPIFEEIAKLIAVILIVSFLKVKKLSTSIFIGWIVGSGFQIAETLGYSTFAGFTSMFNIENIIEEGIQFTGVIDPTVMITRSIYALSSHALYASLSAAGYWFVINGAKDSIKNVRFIIWMILPIMMHMIWNGASILLPDSEFSFYILEGVQVLFFIFLVYLVDCIVREHNREIYSNQSIIIDL